eukprot:351634-Chlamydomonas_euryale.AAC.3
MRDRRFAPSRTRDSEPRDGRRMQGWCGILSGRPGRGPLIGVLQHLEAQQACQRAQARSPPSRGSLQCTPRPAAGVNASGCCGAEQHIVSSIVVAIHAPAGGSSDCVCCTGGLHCSRLACVPSPLKTSLAAR